MRNAVSVLIGVVTLAAASPEAVAAGYDTPILYSARHIGMGGTGIGYVNDPTALFLNPAGIGHTKFITLTANVSPIHATINSFPESDIAGEASAIAPPFLLGAGFRVWDYVTLGLGIYPIASAGGGYEYIGTSGINTTDETAITFIEISPGLGINIPLGPAGELRIGAGYRMTLTSLKRFKETDGATAPFFDLNMSGFDFSGYRLGLQWTPMDGLHIGAVYRGRIDPEIEADDGKLLGQELGKTSMGLVLPSRLGVGARFDILSMGFALDYEYAFQSENETSTIEAVLAAAPDADPLKLASEFRWKDASTIRAGFEYRFLGTMSGRVGYVWDQETSNVSYSSAFGTPPTDTHTGTIGYGFDGGSWEINAAYAFRTGSVEVTEADVDARESICLTCSFPGEHGLTLHGFYLDFSYACE